VVTTDIHSLKTVMEAMLARHPAKIHDKALASEMVRKFAAPGYCAYNKWGAPLDEDGHYCFAVAV
jgi:hypothetical protein